MYGQVWDLFEGITPEEASTFKVAWRHFNDEIVDLIADFAGARFYNLPVIGVPLGFGVEKLTSLIGHLINRGVEAIMTGSTDLEGI